MSDQAFFSNASFLDNLKDTFKHNKNNNNRAVKRARHKQILLDDGNLQFDLFVPYRSQSTKHITTLA